MSFPEFLKSLPDTFRNDGFAREYSLLVEEGDLYLQKGFRDKMKLIWQDDDEFSAGGWDIEFLRDRNDTITGFTVQTGRTGKVTFYKVTS